MSMRQWRLVALGFPVWGVGLYLLADGSWVLGGALMLLGGLFLVIAASGGWGRVLARPVQLAVLLALTASASQRAAPLLLLAQSSTGQPPRVPVSGRSGRMG